MRLGHVVDHKFPVQDGGEIHCDVALVQVLCEACHGYKQWLEQHARRTDQMDQIVAWCDDPSIRPRKRGDVQAR